MTSTCDVAGEGPKSGYVQGETIGGTRQRERSAERGKDITGGEPKGRIQEMAPVKETRRGVGGKDEAEGTGGRAQGHTGMKPRSGTQNTGEWGVHKRCCRTSDAAAQATLSASRKLWHRVEGGGAAGCEIPHPSRVRTDRKGCSDKNGWWRPRPKGGRERRGARVGKQRPKGGRENQGRAYARYEMVETDKSV
jgi:hypothetical protein